VDLLALKTAVVTAATAAVTKAQKE